MRKFAIALTLLVTMWATGPALNSTPLPLLPDGQIAQAAASISGAIRFQKAYGGNSNEGKVPFGIARQPIAVAGPLADGGFLLVGSTESFGAGNGDMYAIRINAQGDVQWSRTYGGSAADYAFDVAGPLADGGFLLVGSTRSFGAGNGDIYAVRINDQGGVVWSKTYGRLPQDDAFAVAGPLSDGGFLLVGKTGIGLDWDMYAVRIDAQGGHQWSKAYGGDKEEEALAVAGPLADGGFLLAGKTSSFGQSVDAYAVRIDGQGNVQWSKNYGGGQYDDAKAIAWADDGFLLVGDTSSFELGTIAYAVRMDSQGNVQWSRTYQGAYGGDTYAIVGPLADGGFLLVGAAYYGSRAGANQMYAARINAQGGFQWGRAYGGNRDDKAFAVAGPSGDGSFLLLGYTESFGAGGVDLYAVRMDGTAGTSGCHETTLTAQVRTPATQVGAPATQTTSLTPTVTTPATQTTTPATQMTTLCSVASGFFLYLPLVCRN